MRRALATPLTLGPLSGFVHRGGLVGGGILAVLGVVVLGAGLVL